MYFPDITLSERKECILYDKYKQNLSVVIEIRIVITSVCGVGLTRKGCNQGFWVVGTTSYLAHGGGYIFT